MELSGEEYRDMVICNNCGWSASLLKGSSGFRMCPVCGKDSIEVIPVSDRERYILVRKGEKGFEIDFDVDK